jgi:hypothetical protein
MATIDKKHVPLLILHWKAKFYRHSSIAEMRQHFEERFLYIPRDEGTIHAWTESALCWRGHLPSDIYEKMLLEYHRAKK